MKYAILILTVLSLIGILSIAAKNIGSPPKPETQVKAVTGREYTKEEEEKIEADWIAAVEKRNKIDKEWRRQIRVDEIKKAGGFSFINLHESDDDANKRYNQELAEALRAKASNQSIERIIAMNQGLEKLETTTRQTMEPVLNTKDLTLFTAVDNVYFRPGTKDGDCIEIPKDVVQSMRDGKGAKLRIDYDEQIKNYAVSIDATPDVIEIRGGPPPGARWYYNRNEHVLTITKD